MIPKIIHQTSPTHKLTPEECRAQSSFKRHHARWSMHLWNDSENDELFLETYPEYYGIWRDLECSILKADIARYVYLYRFGGWYFDTDYCLIKPIPSNLINQLCVLPISGGEGDRHLLCNSVLGSILGYPLWHDFIRFLFQDGTLSSVSEATVEATSGPLGLSNFYRRHCIRYDNAHLVPKQVFHPRVTWMGFGFERNAETCGVHWCWGSWRSKGWIRRWKNRLVRWHTSCRHFS